MSINHNRLGRDNYQPPNLQQFNGKENSKQHVKHFIKTCNDAGTYGDYLMKQFIQFHKENPFDWYTNLKPGFINNWNQLEHVFLNHFYSTRHVISMILNLKRINNMNMI